MPAPYKGQPSDVEILKRDFLFCFGIFKIA